MVLEWKGARENRGCGRETAGLPLVRAPPGAQTHQLLALRMVLQPTSPPDQGSAWNFMAKLPFTCKSVVKIPSSSSQPTRSHGVSRDSRCTGQEAWALGKPPHKEQKSELGRPVAKTTTAHSPRAARQRAAPSPEAGRGDVSWAQSVVQGLCLLSPAGPTADRALAENCDLVTDSAPSGPRGESCCARPGAQKGAELAPEEEAVFNQKRSKKIQKKHDKKENDRLSPS